jgi:hypothetical protein
VSIGPPAVGGDDLRATREQPLGVILVSVRGEMKEGVAAGEHATLRATLAGGAPAGLVHVRALTGAHALSELLAGSASAWPVRSRRPVTTFSTRWCVDTPGPTYHTKTT